MARSSVKSEGMRCLRSSHSSRIIEESVALFKITIGEKPLTCWHSRSKPIRGLSELVPAILYVNVGRVKG
jgi:hypothetical protein